MTIYEAIIQPFVDYGFMRRAIAACIIMAVSSAPLGVFLVVRRMTLIGDAVSHAILPGAAIAFIFTGTAILPMAFSGLAAGIIMAVIAGVITRVTEIKEDASFTAAYMTSLAIGVMIISLKGSSVDLLHLLFGNVLAVDKESLIFITSVATLSLLTLAIIYRPLIMECFDSGFLKVEQAKGAVYHQLFLILIILNLVASFQALGTLMAVGMMILPAIATRFWTKNIDNAIILSIIFAVFAAIIGLLISYHFNLASGPAIVLTASSWYLFSVLFGACDGIIIRLLPRKHFH